MELADYLHLPRPDTVLLLYLLICGECNSVVNYIELHV
jgi:hypothetical protein